MKNIIVMVAYSKAKSDLCVCVAGVCVCGGVGVCVGGGCVCISA